MNTDVSSRAVARTTSAAPVQLRASHTPHLADLVAQPRQLVTKNKQAGRSDVSAPNEMSQPAGPRVLFIEDDDRVRQSLARLLEVKGFRVDCAPDGEIGLMHGLGGRYDVILLDLLLPKRSGIEVLRQLRLEGVWTPVVILTGRGNFDSALEAGRLGVSAYFSKPPVLDNLTAALRTIAESTRTGRPRPGSLGTVGAPTASEGIVSLLLNLEARPTIERVHLARLLANACTGELTFREFIAVAKSIQFLFSQSNRAPALVLARIQDWLEDASTRKSSSLDPWLAQVLSRLEAAGKDWSEIDETGISTELGTDPVTLGHTLAKCGVTFSLCRRAVPMRKAAFELLSGNEHIRQIAFHLGYTDAANFDHAFRSFFGVTPTAFRRLR